MERGELIDGCFWIDRCVYRTASTHIYRAIDVRDRSPIVVRVHTDLSSAGVAYFERTCAVLAASPHPCLERVLGWGALEEDARYAASWLPEGTTVDEALDAGLTAAETTAIATRALAGLARLHEAGVAHGALTSASLVLPGGNPAAALLSEITLVPPALVAAEASLPSVKGAGASHLAPERVRTGSGPSSEADVFALGCVLYRMLTGRLPFAASGVVGTFLRVLYEEPDPIEPQDSDIASRIADAARRMLDKNPEARPSARDILAELEAPSPRPQTLPLYDVANGAHPAHEVGLVLCRELVRGHASLASEGELDGVERMLAVIGGRLDRLSDGTLLVEVPWRSGADAIVHAARAALLVQAALPLGSIVVARGGTGARGLELAESLLSKVGAGRIVVCPDVAPRLEKVFDLEPGEAGPLLFEREPRTFEQGARDAAARTSITTATGETPAIGRPEFDSEVTIVEHKRRTLEVEIVQQPSLDPQPTLEMDMTALAQAMLQRAPAAGAERVSGTQPPMMQHDDTDQETLVPEEVTTRVQRPRPR